MWHHLTSSVTGLWGLWYIYWAWCRTSVVHLLRMMAMPRISIVPVAVCHVLHSFNSNLVCIIQPFIFNSSVGNMYRIKHNPINWYNLQHIVTLASQSNYASRKLRTTHAVIRPHLCQELAFKHCFWWWWDAKSDADAYFQLPPLKRPKESKGRSDPPGPWWQEKLANWL